MAKRILALCVALAVVAGVASRAAGQDVLGEDSAVVTGAGSTFGHPLLSRWAQAYRRFVAGDLGVLVAGGGLDDPPTRTALSYEPVGSLAGIMRVKDRAVDFGASDMPLKSDDHKRLGLSQFPIVIGGIAVAVNLEGVAPGVMQLSGKAIADIYLGQIKNWSDPAIKAMNPNLRLPDAPIAVVRRAEGSGTTFNFTDFLSKASPEWREKVGADLVVAWPVGTGVKGTQGMAEAVRGTRNSIGYLEFAQAMRSGLSYAVLQNRAGRFIRPEPRAFQAAAASAEWRAVTDFDIVLTDAPDEFAYPIVATVFALVPKTASPRKSRATLQFFEWALDRGAQEATALGYVPLPLALVDQVKSYWRQNYNAL